MKHREQNAASNVFSEVRLNANTRRYALTRLKVFTVYEVKVAAENEKGPGPYTPVYRVTTGEKRKLNIRSYSFGIKPFIGGFFFSCSIEETPFSVASNSVETVDLV